MQRLETRQPQILGRRERLAGGTGIVAALLVVVGFIMAGNVPTSGSSFEGVVTYLSEGRQSLLVAAAILTVATTLFLWFAAALAARLRRGEGEPHRLSSLSLAGAVAFVAVDLAGDLPLFALARISPVELSEPVVTAFLAVHTTTHSVTPLLLSAFLAAVALALKGSGLPRWLAPAAAVLALLEIANTVFGSFVIQGLGPESEGDFALLGLFLLWVASTSISMLSRPNTSS